MLYLKNGGRALHDAVLRLVETGRRADADNALLFLSRYVAATGHVAAHPVPPISALEPTPAEETAQDAADELQRAQVLAEALAYLQDRADHLLSELDMTASDDCGDVLAHCLETATTLSDLLGEFAREDAAQQELGETCQRCAMRQ